MLSQWQQKLQAAGQSETPRRSNSKTSLHHSGHLNHNRTSCSDRKTRSRQSAQINGDVTNPSVSSPLVTRPSHTRRLSLDAQVPLSAFDHTIPYHMGYNVHRAPQTPVKLPTSQSAASTLPLLQGDYPRLKYGSKGPLGSVVPVTNGRAGSAGAPDQGGVKYAGPTFHNSPHAASLPKPDLEDF